RWRRCGAAILAVGVERFDTCHRRLMCLPLSPFSGRKAGVDKAPSARLFPHDRKIAALGGGIRANVIRAASPMDRLLLRGRRAALLAVAFVVCASSASAAGVPVWLPHYDLDIQLEIEAHKAQVRERVTWTNRHDTPASELVFNVHSHYTIPDGQAGFLA